jgi:hypothetical protein
MSTSIEVNSDTELTIDLVTQEIDVKQIPIEVSISVPEAPDIVVGMPGPTGPPGPQGQWVSLTQVEYDALDPPDLDTLYVIVD